MEVTDPNFNTTFTLFFSMIRTVGYILHRVILFVYLFYKGHPLDQNGSRNGYTRCIKE